MKTNSDKKRTSSLGPCGMYYDLALLTFYTPYWRKVARLLGNIRRMNHIDFNGTSYQRMTTYARRAFKDTKLPRLVKFYLREGIKCEFKFDIAWKDNPVYAKKS